MYPFFQISAIILAGITALLSLLLFVKLRWPAAVLWLLKLYVSALASFFVAIGVYATVVGLVSGSVPVMLLGLYDASIFFMYILRVTQPPDPSTGFERAFGAEWKSTISPALKKQFLKTRRFFRLPITAKAQMEQNVPFATIAGTSRQLLCDIWQPPKDVTPSGLALIYLHGSAFYFLDKDYETRPFFQHLAAQGHVIMDVAYRLSPETDVMGMVHDVRRAINWMKENAVALKVDPSHIVLGGGSAGGHLALLAAYTTHDDHFTPADLLGRDMSVSAVMSFYGTSDFEALYYHTNQHLTTREIPGGPKKSPPTKMPAWIVKRMGSEYYRLGLDKPFKNIGTLKNLLGGHPDECPEKYALYSPVNHVHRNCPPTYLIHGEHDIMAPVISTKVLCGRLIENGVPVVMHLLPRTEHAYDLVLPNISPSAHTEFYETERFLALQLSKPLGTAKVRNIETKEPELIH